MPLPPAADGGPGAKEFQVTAVMPTEYGSFSMAAWAAPGEKSGDIAMIYGDRAQLAAAGGDGPVLVRLHSACFTGETMCSHRCDCGEQLQRSMQIVAEAGCGVVLYLQQEGRGIGLVQ